MRTAATIVLLASIAPIVVAGDGFELVWQDEFEDLFVDSAKWEIMIGDGSNYGLPAGWGNNELQYYTARPQNVSTASGNLRITAIRENFNGSNFTSARLRTKGRFAFQYGKAEARINLAIGEGLWPAFWMLPEQNTYGGWAASGELDIMEASDDAQAIFGTIHYGGQWPQNQYRGGVIVDSFGEEFHVYAVEWEPDRIRWYIDGQLFHTETSGNWFTLGAAGDSNAPFDQPFHLLLNMAVGGNFTTNPGPGAPFPKTMLVDWVRVYQQAQTPFPGSPHQIPGRVEAEDFDFGYDGQAYHDVDAANQGGAYRPESGVDLQAASEGGFNVGWIRPGEWIEYTVNIQQPGDYRIDTRVASQSSGGSFRLLFDGQDLGASFTAPVTGGWQTWTTRTAEVTLPAGETVMRFENLGGTGQEFNISWFDFAFLGSDCPADLAPPQGILDLADISAFATGFLAQDTIADLAAPFGVLDLADINAFVTAFLAGCP